MSLSSILGLLQRRDVNLLTAPVSNALPSFSPRRIMSYTRSTLVEGRLLEVETVRRFWSSLRLLADKVGKWWLRRVPAYYLSEEWATSISNGEQPLLYSVAYPEEGATIFGTLVLTETRLLYKAPLIHATAHSNGQPEVSVEIPLGQIGETSLRKPSFGQWCMMLWDADLIVIQVGDEWIRYHVGSAKDWLKRIDDARLKAAGSLPA